MSEIQLLSDLLDLVRAGIDGLEEQNSWDESRELVSSVLKISPGELSFAIASNRSVSSAVANDVKKALERFLSGMPMAYATGNAAFRNLVLDVDERVLIPRPETEVVVEHALRVGAIRPGGIAIDIGTGSGAIAISLAMEGIFDRIIATDISRDALDVACSNAKVYAEELKSILEFRSGADMQPVLELKARVIVSNPPYIAFEEAEGLPSRVRNWEPATALYADSNGMARYEELLRSAPLVLEPGGWLVLECDSVRARATFDLAASVGAYGLIELFPDMTGRDRVLVAQTAY